MFKCPFPILRRPSPGLYVRPIKGTPQSLTRPRHTHLNHDPPHTHLSTSHRLTSSSRRLHHRTALCTAPVRRPEFVISDDYCCTAISITHTVSASEFRSLWRSYDLGFTAPRN